MKPILLIPLLLVTLFHASFAAKAEAIIVKPCPLDHCIYNERGFMNGFSDKTPKKYYEGDVSRAYLTHYCNSFPKKCR